MKNQQSEGQPASTGTFVSWKVLTAFSGMAALVAALVLNIAGIAQHSLTMSESQDEELVVHSRELLLVQSDISSLRKYVTERTKERYTEKDAERDLNYINRRLERLEDHIQKELDRGYGTQ